MNIKPITREEARRIRRQRGWGVARLDSGSLGKESSPWSRWTFIGGPPTRHLRCDGKTLITTVRDARGVIQTWNDPRDALQWMSDSLPPAADEYPPFTGGWIGYLSYDLGRCFEPALPRAHSRAGEAEAPWPAFEFTCHPSALAHDGLKNTWMRIEAGMNDEPIEFPEPMRPATRAEPTVQSNFTRAQYLTAVERGLECIRAGDIFQVNLSQRLSSPLLKTPGEVYEQLRRHYPAWFGALLIYGEHALICNSPELFLRVEPTDRGRRIVTRPVKGTRARSSQSDAALRDSVKDQAELNMIVDLERNDLGRVCRVGSVKVTQGRAIEAHATVHHGAATIEGVLRDDVRFIDLLAATFPGGSVTGAPKIRAMQIIDELEPAPRGPYCGAIGWLSGGGAMEFNIAIRTMLARNGYVYIPVGGGIVADSSPAEEYEETLVKAQAMVTALGFADLKRD
jgi:para-aminobenzoate synthetase component 1